MKNPFAEASSRKTVLCYPRITMWTVPSWGDPTIAAASVSSNAGSASPDGEQSGEAFVAFLWERSSQWPLKNWLPNRVGRIRSTTIICRSAMFAHRFQLAIAPIGTGLLPRLSILPRRSPNRLNKADCLPKNTQNQQPAICGFLLSVLQQFPPCLK